MNIEKHAEMQDKLESVLEYYFNNSKSDPTNMTCAELVDWFQATGHNTIFHPDVNDPS